MMKSSQEMNNESVLANKKWDDFYNTKEVKEELERIEEELRPITSTSLSPQRHMIFRVFNTLGPEEIKVMIVGQDPYLDRRVADGFCFSVQDSYRRHVPPSLQRIGQVLQIDFRSRKEGGSLESWVHQGVFLINTALTTMTSTSGSHASLWKPFFLAFMKWMNEHTKHIVYVLWGNHAKQYAKYINKEQNLILTSCHPSPLAGKAFLTEAKNHFQDANHYLIQHNKTPINWT
jgi:uracil-DNA glycosylase